MYFSGVMNQQASSNSITSADSISRRAYELWENEGRPEGNDLRHWLQAERELAGSSGFSSASPMTDTSRGTDSSAPRNTGTDTRPLQGTRAAGAANRENRRNTNTPFNEKNGTVQGAGRRKPTNAPVL
jgi:hypothetical protein